MTTRDGTSASRTAQQIIHLSRTVYIINNNIIIEVSRQTKSARRKRITNTDETRATPVATNILFPQSSQGPGSGFRKRSYEQKALEKNRKVEQDSICRRTSFEKDALERNRKTQHRNYNERTFYTRE